MTSAWRRTTASCRSRRRGRTSTPRSPSSTTTPPSTRSSCSCRSRTRSTRRRHSSSIDPDKDVDGLHPVNLGRLVMGVPAPRPCTPLGIQALLADARRPDRRQARRHRRSRPHHRPPAGAAARAEASRARQRRGDASCTPVCPTSARYTRQADILIAAAGRASIITARHGASPARSSWAAASRWTAGESCPTSTSGATRSPAGSRPAWVASAPRRSPCCWPTPSTQPSDEGSGREPRRVSPSAIDTPSCPAVLDTRCRRRTSAARDCGRRPRRRGGDRPEPGSSRVALLWRRDEPPRRVPRYPRDRRGRPASSTVQRRSPRTMAQKITLVDGQLNVPDRPDHPVHRGRRHRRRHLARGQARARRRGRRSTARRSSGKRCSPARRRSTRRATGCPRRRSTSFRDYLIGIKGPLTTPIGGGIRSLNVALRQILDLYVCLRPVRWFTGVPSPVKHPEKVDMVIFRENTEDIYAGLEVEEGTPEAKKLIELLKDTFGWEIKPDSGIGIKPISESGSKRLIRAAIEYAVQAQPQERHARAQGQHHEVHRGRVPELGLRAHPRRVLRRRRRLGRLRRQPRRQDPREGRDRRHHAAAGAHPPRRVRRDRHA